MNQFTPTIYVDALDYFGQPYKKPVSGNPPKDYAKLRREFMAAWEAENKRREAMGPGYLPVNEGRVNDYFEQKLYNDANQSY